METTLQTLISTLKHEPSVYFNNNQSRQTPILARGREYETRRIIVFYDENNRVLISCEADFHDAPLPDGSKWKHTDKNKEIFRFVATRPTTLGNVAIYDLDNNLLGMEKYQDMFLGRSSINVGETLILCDIGYRP